jgi:hypothetical protein
VVQAQETLVLGKVNGYERLPAPRVHPGEDRRAPEVRDTGGDANEGRALDEAAE